MSTCALICPNPGHGGPAPEPARRIAIGPHLRMNFSKTTAYALLILDFLARNEREQYSATELHRRLKIPRQYLRQLLTNLSKSGFIRSTRGRHGGFALNRESSSISIAEIIDAVEGLDVFNRCLIGLAECPFDGVCAMHDAWQAARAGVVNVLKNTSLADLRK
jgi:Rrf2 family protein